MTEKYHLNSKQTSYFWTTMKGYLRMSDINLYEALKTTADNSETYGDFVLTAALSLLLYGTETWPFSKTLPSSDHVFESLPSVPNLVWNDEHFQSIIVIAHAVFFGSVTSCDDLRTTPRESFHSSTGHPHTGNDIAAHCAAGKRTLSVITNLALEYVPTISQELEEQCGSHELAILILLRRISVGDPLCSLKKTR